MCGSKVDIQSTTAEIREEKEEAEERRRTEEETTGQKYNGLIIIFIIIIRFVILTLFLFDYFSIRVCATEYAYVSYALRCHYS